MSQAGRVYESLSGPLTSKPEAQVDGVVGLGEIEPKAVSAHTAGEGSSSAKPGLETHESHTASGGIARRSPSHYLEGNAS